MSEADRRPWLERVRRRAEYGALRGLQVVLRLLPLGLAYRLVEAGLLTFYRFSRYRERAMASLEIAFGDELSPGGLEALLWRSVRYQAWFFLDVLLAGSLLGDPRRAAALDLSAWEEAKRDHDARYPGTGAILVTGHVGTPEAASLAGARAFWPHLGLARKLDNRLVWQWFLTVRDRFDRPTVDRSGVLRAALRRLRDGGSVGMLNDQNAGPRGEFVPYFGRLASTHAGAAALAVHTGAPIYALCFPRTRPRRFEAKAEISGPFFADPDVDKDSEIHRLTALITAEIEAMVRRHPEQALWAHRRWKTRPPEESDPS